MNITTILYCTGTENVQSKIEKEQNILDPPEDAAAELIRKNKEENDDENGQHPTD